MSASRLTRRPRSSGTAHPVGPPPDPAGHPTVGLEDAGVLLARFKVSADDGELPSLNSMVISILGPGLSGKTTLVAGNPHCAIAKLPDGSPIVRGKRATVIEIPDLETFENWTGEMLDYARQHGVNGKWQCIAIDPTILLTNWLGNRELELYNRGAKIRFERSKEYGQIPSDEDWIPVRNLADIPGTGVWHKIAGELGNIITQFKGLGWGVFFLTHYGLKAKYNKAKGVPDGEVWGPNIPPTSASKINEFRDLILVCTRIVTDRGPMHFIEFASEQHPEAGSRIPIGLDGALALPVYKRGITTTSWAALKAIIDKARIPWKQEYDEFQAAMQRPQAEASPQAAAAPPRQSRIRPRNR